MNSFNIFMLKIELEDSEVTFLTDFIKKGQKNARPLTRARILLLANQEKGDTEIAKILGIGRNTVLRIRKRYLEEGLQSALVDKPRPGQPEKYNERHVAEIIAQVCVQPPDGRKRWSLTLLTEELREKEGFETINRESVRLILKKAKLNHG
jgi:putative transposase